MCDTSKNNSPKNKNARKGSSLQDKKAHAQDHKRWSRRSFLSTLGIAGGMGLSFGNFSALAMSPSPIQAALAASDTDRVLLLIRLKGGNDGLNTIVPLYDYGTYTTLRPNLAITPSNMIELNDEVGMPNFMSALQGLWNEGQMKVAHSIGYPNPNLSHFRGSDIWANGGDGDTEPDQLSTGWLGRFFENQYPDFLVNPPSIPPAIQIGSNSNLMFRSETAEMGLSVANPEVLYEIAQTGALYDVTDVPECYYGEQLAFTRSVINNTFIYAETIKEAYDASSTDADYTMSNPLDNGRFANQMQIVARLIKGNLGTKVYMVELGGFDTHEGQVGVHDSLMTIVSESVKAFYEDLQATGYDGKVLTMTVSEFGRRIEENGSLGTDHGASAPALFFGPALENNDFIGAVPDLLNPDENGNLVYDTDFRSLYATVLQNWLCVSPDLVDEVMGQSFPRIEGIATPCNVTYAYEAQSMLNSLQHRALYDPTSSNIVIEYTLPFAERVQVDIYNISGQLVTTLFSGNQVAGLQRINFNPRKQRLPFGQYVYRITLRNTSHSKMVSVLR